ncbi:tRNA (adenosine(37)-N6)-dimethylallyltransferase MiaA [Sedimentimonas flavescens]|uniref:tRNA (adenosine(37)-N6)-dimethylallyltransferase MiaA n=1 Tax=Sedimentimonas flavescens TaxID=2851012 RepID=UPI0021A65C8D|nr:tRNA (adenosine(37)-N6)-dimethylallyltransferase MiaA [Sedimentimonas flavescens]MCT2540627.1 tRNA (adenosine(37)-N6)-dimethylallyltransferase MiaA [Sedimentimonas flavescens]
MNDNLPQIRSDAPVLIAGATASGKSALALEIARDGGGVIVNADALQIWSCWRVLSARPSVEDETSAPHVLYGHKQPGEDCSVGHWLREAQPLIAAHRAGGPRPIIVGGTGLYLTALTEGLADIPATPPEVRAEADARRTREGHEAMLAELDPETRGRVDPLNPMRVQRAWEVMRATGRGLAAWQDDTPPPLLPLSDCVPLVIEADRDWLAERIDCRFDLMLEQGALDEVRAILPIWDREALWAKAIGAPELVDYLRGDCDLDEARARAQAASRQYAKRQRTWFRARMRDWHKIVRP